MDVRSTQDSTVDKIHIHFVLGIQGPRINLKENQEFKIQQEFGVGVAQKKDLEPGDSIFQKCLSFPRR